MSNIKKEYSNGEVTIVWQPHLCIHSENCFKGLPQVFDPKKKPWIKPEGASTHEIINQVDKCPSGALSTYTNKNNKEIVEMENTDKKAIKIQVMENGPYIIEHDIEVHMPDGTVKEKTKRAALCRCGKSSTKPFCDGTHLKENWIGN